MAKAEARARVCKDSSPFEQPACLLTLTLIHKTRGDTFIRLSTAHDMSQQCLGMMIVTLEILNGEWMVFRG